MEATSTSINASHRLDAFDDVVAVAADARAEELECKGEEVDPVDEEGDDAVGAEPIDPNVALTAGPVVFELLGPYQTYSMDRFGQRETTARAVEADSRQNSGSTTFRRRYCSYRSIHRRRC